MKNEEVLERVGKELTLQGKSPATVKSYVFYLDKLFEFSKKPHSKILFEDIKKFLEHLSMEKSYSASSMNLAKSAISFYYEEMLEKYPVKKIKVGKIGRSLPVVLTKSEVKKIIESAQNLKEKLIVQVMYSCGLRVSEATNLKIEDLDFDDLTGTIRRGKGKKDRIIFLSNTLVKNIQEYLDSKKTSSEYLFSKPNGKPYTTRAFQIIIKKLAKRAGIRKKVYSHIFRHAFGTHLVEDGVDIVRVQSMMGHSSLDTTRLYITLSKKHLKEIKNPLDSLYD